MYCPQCGTQLPEGATYCTQCAAVVDPVDHVVKTLGRVTKNVLDTTGVALGRAAKAVEPVVDKTMKAIEPTAQKVVQVTKEAADKTARAVGPAAQKAARVTKTAADKAAKAVTPAVEKVATATERAARNVREKTQRRRSK